MFSKLKLWLLGSSGLREATRDAAREATREGFLEGIRLGLGDALESLESLTDTRAVKTITPAINGHQNGHRKPLTASELRGKRKADLLELAEERGLVADDSWTVSALTEALTS